MLLFEIRIVEWNLANRLGFNGRSDGAISMAARSSMPLNDPRRRLPQRPMIVVILPLSCARPNRAPARQAEGTVAAAGL